MIRIGFIGAGRMAHVHAGLLHEERDVGVMAACDHGSGRAGYFTRDWGAAAYSDYRRMLDEQALDAVYICTPTRTHAEIGLECAERGLAVFVEKPLDLDLNAAVRLCRMVERRRLVSMTGLQWRYTAGYRRAVDLIGDDPIALVVLRWYWTRPPIRWMWERDEAGGQVVDQSIHLIDAGQALAGDILSIYAAYNQRQVNLEPEFRNWDGYALTLRFGSGAVGTCSGTYGLFPEIQERPSVDLCLHDRMVRITDEGVFHFTAEGVQGWPNEEPLHCGINRAFVEAVRAGDPAHVPTPLAAGLRSTAAALAANRSAENGRVVVVSEFLSEFVGEEEVGP